MSSAREQAQRILSEATQEANRKVASAQEEIDSLKEQRQSLSSYIEDMRAILSGPSSLALHEVVDSAAAKDAEEDHA